MFPSSFFIGYSIGKCFRSSFHRLIWTQKHKNKKSVHEWKILSFVFDVDFWLKLWQWKYTVCDFDFSKISHEFFDCYCLFRKLQFFGIILWVGNYVVCVSPTSQVHSTVESETVCNCIHQLFLILLFLCSQLYDIATKHKSMFPNQTYKQQMKNKLLHSLESPNTKLQTRTTRVGNDIKSFDSSKMFPRMVQLLLCVNSFRLFQKLRFFWCYFSANFSRWTIIDWCTTAQTLCLLPKTMIPFVCSCILWTSPLISIMVTQINTLDLVSHEFQIRKIKWRMKQWN